MTDIIIPAAVFSVWIMLLKTKKGKEFLVSFVIFSGMIFIISLMIGSMIWSTLKLTSHLGD